LLKGNGVNATISAASAIPFYGIIASGSRMGWKVVGSASDLQSKKIHRWVLDLDNKITFGYHGDLARNFPNMPSGFVAHHILPFGQSIQRHPVIQKVASKDGFHMNESINGLPLPSIRNHPNHNAYNNFIGSKLDYIQNNYPQSEWNTQVSRLIEAAKTAINATDAHINTITFRFER